MFAASIDDPAAPVDVVGQDVAHPGRVREYIVRPDHDGLVGLELSQGGGGTAGIEDIHGPQVAKGQELASILDSEVWAILLGEGLAELLDQLVQFGADHVLAADHAELPRQ